MNCPACGHKDYFLNFLGPDCLNERCKHFRNGHKDGLSASELAAKKAARNLNRKFYPGAQVMIDRGMAWSNEKEDGVLLSATLIAYHPDGIPEPYWKVSLNKDYAMPPDSYGKQAVAEAGTQWGIYVPYISWPDDDD